MENTLHWLKYYRITHLNSLLLKNYVSSDMHLALYYHKYFLSTNVDL